MTTCGICYIDSVDKQLMCKHELCTMCFVRTDFCPYCRAHIPKINQVLEDIIEWFDPQWDYHIIKRSDSCTLANFLFHFSCGARNPWFLKPLKGTNMALYNPKVINGIRYKGSGRYFP